MSGLEKIIAQIEEETDSRIREITAAAEEQIRGIFSASEKQTDEDVKRLTEKADHETVSLLEKGKASAQLKKRQILLTGKQELILDTVELAKKKISALSDEKYAELLAKLFEKYLPESDAVLQFSAKDLERIPESMKQDFVRKAAEKGAKLTISDIPAEIADGFLLDFGGVEENCSFEALINENREKLEDRIKQILFS